MRKLLGICLVLFLILSGCEGQEIPNDPTNPKDQDTVNIYFDTNGGSTIPMMTLQEGEIIELPEDPVKSGYIFIGWYMDEDFENLYNFTTIDQDITLYAKWDEEVLSEVTITFVTKRDYDISAISGYPGSAVTKPTDPNDQFYDFLGWKIKGTDDYFDFSTGMPNEDVTLVADWQKNEYYKLTIYFNYDSRHETMILKAGDPISLDTDLTRDDYVFLGWYFEYNFVNKADGLTLMPEEHVDLYAFWVSSYEITFENTGDTYIETITQVGSMPVETPETPMKTGYLFQGWYMDEALSVPFDFGSTINEDITLFAKWERDPNMVKISFETYGGSEVSDIYGYKDEPIPIPKTTLKAGNILLGWYKDEAFTQTVFSTLYTDTDLTLYAKWYEYENVVYIFFDSNGGSEVDPYQKRPGQGIAAPSEPTKPGYDFVGWYEDEAFTRRYYFMAMGNETLTLYARWQKIETQNDEAAMAVENVLSGWDFDCLDHVCTLEVSSGFTYVFNFNTNTFSYVKQIIEENDSGYRYYDSVITFDVNWNVEYTYEVEEDFGFEFYTLVNISGNYETGVYEIDVFESNIQSEDARYDAAVSSIEYFGAFIESVLDAANLLLDDLN